PHDRFDIVSPSVDSAFRPDLPLAELERVRKKYAIDGPYLLYVGLLQPRKNLVRLARAFARLKDCGLGHKLVIAGRKAWLYDEFLAAINDLGLDDRLLFTGYVPAEDLP